MPFVWLRHEKGGDINWAKRGTEVQRNFCNERPMKRRRLKGPCMVVEALDSIFRGKHPIVNCDSNQTGQFFPLYKYEQRSI